MITSYTRCKEHKTIIIFSRCVFCVHVQVQYTQHHRKGGQKRERENMYEKELLTYTRIVIMRLNEYFKAINH